MMASVHITVTHQRKGGEGTRKRSNPERKETHLAATCEQHDPKPQNKTQNSKPKTLNPNPAACLAAPRHRGAN